jgi:hypothetical protein
MKMAGKSTTLMLNYSRLEDVPDTVTGDTYYQKHLSKLYLKQNLIVNLTPSIARLSSLTELHLHSNHLVSLPDAIGELSSLTNLTLDSNHLTFLNPCVVKLKNLQSLSISRNDLTSLPKELWRCRNLTSVNASANKITSLDPSILECRTLQRLDLDRNLLTQLPVQLCCLRSLRELSLSGNRLKFLPSDCHQLSSLSSLLVDAHPKLSSLPASLVFCNSLVEFGIEGCGGELVSRRHLQTHAVWFVDEALYAVGAIRQQSAPVHTLQELAARTVHQHMTVVASPNSVWLQEDLKQILNVPRVLCSQLIPSAHCIACGVPIMCEPYIAIVNCTHSQAGENQPPLLLGTAHWLSSSALYNKGCRCACDSHVTWRQQQHLHTVAHTLSKCDILGKLWQKGLMMRFDFCSIHCGNSFINFILAFTFGV